MSLVFNMGGMSELHVQKQPFFSDYSATTSGYKLSYSLSVSGNKPFPQLQKRNLILILYYVLAKEKHRFFFFSWLTGIANYPSQWEITNI